MMNFDEVSSHPYLSGYTYRSMADYGVCDSSDTQYMQDVCPGIDPTKVKSGDLLYVTGMKVRDFFMMVSPFIKVPFFLITAQWDAGPDESFIELFPDNLITWFTINNHLDHPKVEGIPLGLQNRHWRLDGNVQSEPSTYTTRNDVHKSKTIMASFSVRNNISERSECLNMGIKHFGESLTTHSFRPDNRQDENFVTEYFDEVAKHKFVLCPWGAGIDTHRLWEAMYLGCIPVTRYHTCYRDFTDMPIVFLDNWFELDTLNKTAEPVFKMMSEENKQSSSIYPGYWERKINEQRSNYTDRPLPGV